MGISVHAITALGVQPLDVTQIHTAVTIHVTLEFGNRRMRSFLAVETDHAGTSGAPARFVLHLGLLNLPNGAKQIHEIIVAGRPWELKKNWR
jgi:hypothetical protein